MKIRILSVLFLMVVMVIPACAAYDMYLAVEDVAGTPGDAAHKDWIPVSEIQDNTLKPGGVISLVINKAIDGSSGPLYRDCLMATTRPHAILDVCKDGVILCRTTMTVCSITQIKPKFTKTDPGPQEELTFSFRAINWEFYSTGADGKAVTTRSGWDNILKRVM
jgi:type VI protein secretion system component Hcp